MAKGKKKRTLSFRRAYAIDSDFVLGKALNDVLANKPNVGDTSFTRPDAKTWQIQNRAYHGDVLYLHVATFTAQEPTTGVPKLAVKSPTAPLSSIATPSDADYLDGDAMLLIDGNDCVMCAGPIKEGSLALYLNDLLQLDPSHYFNWKRVADRQAMKKLLSRGVKSIHLNVIDYAARVPEPEASRGVDKLVDTVRRGVNDIFGQDIRAADAVHQANLSASLVLRADGRRIDSVELQQVAGELVDEDPEGFEIELKGGLRITSNEVFLRASRDIEAFAKTVNHTAAWAEMTKFYDELKASGVIHATPS